MVSKQAPVFHGVEYGEAFFNALKAHKQYEEMDEIQRRHDGRELYSLYSNWMHNKGKVEEMLRAVGKRYQHCTFDNFEIKSKEQQAVVDALRKYVADAEQNIADGRCVLLLGPSGGGKDHLLIALAKEIFAKAGRAAEWINGMELMERFHQHSLGNRKNILDSERWDMLRDDEDDGQRELILYCSDPIPPTGPLSPAMQQRLFALVDGYYRKMIPIWMSLNVADRKEANERLGVPVVDRLVDRALIIPCAWESHRKKQEA